MKRLRCTIVSAAAAVLCIALLCGFRTAPQAAAGDGYIKAAMYFGNEWQINFWTAEHAQAEEDFARMREDGFNTIILVVPWRAFQPSLNGSVNQTMLGRLDRLMDRAEAAGLGVMLRVGYTWDMADGDDVIERFNRMVSDTGVRGAWKNYLAAVSQTARRHPNFTGAFLTWEDFWNYIPKAESLAQRGDRIEPSRTGYTAYVKEHYTMEELTALYGEGAEKAGEAYPAQSDPAYRLFLEWYDTVLDEILAESQEVFPELSMECRLHQDNVYTVDGRLEGYSHHSTFPAGSAPYTSVMLSVDMAAGRGTSSGSVASTDRSLLSFMRAEAGKPVFVDQFLYTETTPGYEYLPQISDSIGSYLVQMGPVFRDCTMGYGLWAYKDYTDNIVYNPEFGLMLDGWTAVGGRVEQTDGNNKLRLSRGGKLSQNFGSRAYLSDKPSRVRLSVTAERPATLTAVLGGETRTAEVPEGTSEITLEYSRSLRGSLTVSASDEVLLDNIQVYSHVTEGGIYDLNGAPGPWLDGLRRMNAAMN